MQHGSEIFGGRRGLTFAAPSSSFVLMLDRDDPANCRRLSREEIEKEIAFALHLQVGRVKLGRVTFREAVERGFPWLAQRLADCLYPHILFLKKPPNEWHGRFEG